MRSLSKNIVVEEIRMAGKQRRKEKRNTPEAKAKRAVHRKGAKTMEWKRTQKNYPDSTFRFLIIKNVHPQMHLEFMEKCEALHYTMSGKVRKLVEDLLNGRIDEYKLQYKMGDFDIYSGYGKVPKKMQDRSTMLTLSKFPVEMVDDLTRYCKLRGISVSWKIKQLIIAWMRGVIQ